MENSQFHGTLGKLRSWGLPMFVSPNHAELEENDHITSTLFGRLPDSRHRRLVLSFDRTYLTRSLQLCQGDQGSMMVGGAHRPQNFELLDESKIPLKKESGEPQFFSKDKLVRANEMESFQVWDCARSSSCIVEIAAFPVLSAASVDPRLESMVADTKHCRGKWEVLCRLGEVLDAATSVPFLLCDGATSHEWMHSLLLGKTCAAPWTGVELIPFFNKLQHEEMPSTEFPLLHVPSI